MSSFTTPLVLDYIDGRRWRLAEAFEYRVGGEHSADVIRVPRHFETDFASIPRPLWAIYPPTGQYGKAAVIHDYLCQTQTRSSKEAHAIFRDAMADLGVPRVRREMFYRAVLWFGPRFEARPAERAAA